MAVAAAGTSMPGLASMKVPPKRKGNSNADSARPATYAEPQ